MATPHQGKKPAPRKTSSRKPAPAKKVAGKAAPTRKGAQEKASEEDAPQLGLTLKQQRFVDEYMVDLNATQAAIRAGYSSETAQEQSSRLLSNVMVQAAISAARSAQQKRTSITADTVLMEIANVALADARELVEVKTGCCRCCWGEGHKSQRTIGEYNHDREQWLLKGKDPLEFDEEGGIGFNPLKLPHPECPNCGGDGQARTVLKDTRHLSPRAAALYAGAKQTKDGIEIKMHSKLDALEKLAKHVGLYEKDNSQRVDPLAALLGRIASGNGNGFAPVADDPERQPSSSIPVSSVDDED